MTKLSKVSCKNCNKIFYRPNGRYNEAVKFNWNQYCSKKCEYKNRTTKKILACENCGENFERELSAVSKHNFCSRSCAAIINNKKYEHRRMLPIFRTCKQCRKKYRKSTGNKKYCSRFCRNTAMQYTKGELLEAIKNAFKKLKRVPARRELPKGINDACRKSFGSWNKAVSTAGFIPNRSHNDRMYKRIKAVAEDGHLCDSVSELLIDNWLYKNNILHKKDVFYPTTQHKTDWQIIFDNQKIFVEYFGLANDSPRYDRCIKEKLKLCNKNNVSLIAIYPKDLYPKNFLEDNLKNKFKNYLSA